MTIINGALPAMPIEYNGWGEPCNGLTKREMFAMAAMQGILSKGGTGEIIAEKAVEYADALLAELERTK